MFSGQFVFGQGIASYIQDFANAKVDLVYMREEYPIERQARECKKEVSVRTARGGLMLNRNKSREFNDNER